MKLKILSWNIWIEGDFDKASDFLKKSDADIIGLQEVMDDDPKRDVISFLKNLGYKYVFAPIEKPWGTEVSGEKPKIFRDGPAVFSKYPVLKTQTYSLSKVDTRVAARADILVNDKAFHIFSTHLIHTHQKESEVQKEQITNLIKNLQSEKTIVMGDFNATPESSIMQMMKKILVDSDLSSTPTWSVYPKGCAYCNPQKIDTRLDYTFVSKDIKILSSKVEQSKASDHLPISTVIEI